MKITDLVISSGLVADMTSPTELDTNLTGVYLNSMLINQKCMLSATKEENERLKAELQQTRSALDANVTATTREKQKINFEIEKLKEKNYQLYRSLCEMETEKDYVIKSLQNELRTLTDLIQSNNNIRSNLECTNQKLNSGISALKEELIKVEQELNAKHKLEYNAWSTAYIKLQKELNYKNEVIDSLKLDHQGLKKDFAKQAEDIARLKGELDQKRRNIQQMNDQMTVETTKRNNLEKHVSGLSKRITSLKEENNALLRDFLQERNPQTTDKKRNNLQVENENLSSRISDLQRNIEKLEIESAQKLDDLQYLRGLLEEKIFELSKQNANNINLQDENKNLTSEISKLQANLTKTQAKFDLISNKPETDDAKHAEEEKAWNSSYQELQNDYSKYKTELSSYKSYKVAMKISEICKQMENLSTDIDSAIKNLSKQAYTENRTYLSGKVNEMTQEYNQMTSELECHKLIMPNMNFAIRLSKYQRITEENETGLKMSFRKVYDIQRDLKTSHCKIYEVIKIVDEIQELIDRNSSVLSPLILISLNWELEEEKDIYREIKTAYEEARTFFNNVLKDSKPCKDAVQMLDSWEELPFENVERRGVKAKRKKKKKNKNH